MGIVRVELHEGKLDEFKRLSAQCVEIVRAKDPGTLQYDTYINDDQSECIVVERFTDSEALIEHGASLADLMEAILATGSFSGELLGEPSAEVRARLAGSEVPQLHALADNVDTLAACAEVLAALAFTESWNVKECQKRARERAFIPLRRLASGRQDFRPD